jgi:hypothetical protein
MMFYDAGYTFQFNHELIRGLIIIQSFVFDIRKILNDR